ncbi:MAG: hypothetical protein AAGF90_17860 [Pseudomonadota bacterium]
MEAFLAQLDFTDPLIVAAVVAAVGMPVVMLLLLFALLAARRSAKAAAPLAEAIASLGGAVRTLDQGQQQLTGGLRHVGEAQAAAQARMIETMERRLEEVQRKMGESPMARRPARRAR